MKEKYKNFFKNAILLFLTIFFLFGILEIYFKYFYITTGNIDIALSSKDWDKKYCKYNSDGFRDDREFSKTKAKQIFRIGILGDSWVFGQGINNKDDRFSNILGKLIRHKYKINCEVYNMGVRGWSTLDEMNYFVEKGAFYKLDALVLCSLELEDFSESLPVETYEPSWVEASQRNPLVLYLIKNSYAFGFFYSRVCESYYMHLTNTTAFENEMNSIIFKRDNWQRYFNYINEIKNKCEDEGASFYIVSFKPLGWSNNKRLGRILSRFEKLFKKYLDLHQINYIFLDASLYKYKEEDLVVSNFDAHPNERFNKIVAEQLLNLLDPQIKPASVRIHDLAFDSK